MNKTVALAAIAVLVSGCGTMPFQSGGWESLFDGKTLNGWTQLNGTAKYWVEDGTIVGQTSQGSPNSFLCSDKKFGDFELEFEVKCDTGLNSGVQLRSAQKTAKDVASSNTKKNNGIGRVFGPQVEIEASPGQSGYIYGEATGLGWLSPEPRSKDKSVNEHSYFKNGQWNKYRVICQGPRFQTFINGVKVCDLTDDEIYKTHPRGFLGLQVHAIGANAGPYRVAWRNIRIRELK